VEKGMGITKVNLQVNPVASGTYIGHFDNNYGNWLTENLCRHFMLGNSACHLATMPSEISVKITGTKLIGLRIREYYIFD